MTISSFTPLPNNLQNFKYEREREEMEIKDLKGAFVADGSTA